jgi:hypothetical protein
VTTSMLRDFFMRTAILLCLHLPSTSSKTSSVKNNHYFYEPIDRNPIPITVRLRQLTTLIPSQSESPRPTHSPVLSPSSRPTHTPTPIPSHSPTQSESPVIRPSTRPTHSPVLSPSSRPTHTPTPIPSHAPTQPTSTPSQVPTQSESPIIHSTRPTHSPVLSPSSRPTHTPTPIPSHSPTQPTSTPSQVPTQSESPIIQPSTRPTHSPVLSPSSRPTHTPTPIPSHAPTQSESLVPSLEPSRQPTSSPTSLNTISLDISLLFYCETNNDIDEDAVVNTVADVVQEISTFNIKHYSVVFGTSSTPTTISSSTLLSQLFGSSYALQAKVQLSVVIDLTTTSFANDVTGFNDEVYLELSESITDGTFNTDMLQYCSTCDTVLYAANSLVHYRFLPSSKPTAQPTHPDLQQKKSDGHRASLGIIYTMVSIVLVFSLFAIVKWRGLFKFVKSPLSFASLSNDDDEDDVSDVRSSPFHHSRSSQRQYDSVEQTYDRSDAIELSSFAPSSSSSVLRIQNQNSEIGIVQSYESSNAASSNNSTYQPPEFVVL